MAEEKKSKSWWETFEFAHPWESTKKWAKRKAMDVIGVPDVVAEYIGGDDKDKSKEASVSVMDAVKQKVQGVMGGGDEKKPEEEKGMFGGLFDNMSMGKGAVMGAAAMFGIYLLGKKLFGGLFGGNDEEKKKEEAKQEEEGASFGSVLWAGVKSALAAVGVAMVAKAFGSDQPTEKIVQTAAAGFLTGAFRNATTRGTGGGIETGLAAGVTSLVVDKAAEGLGVKSPLAKIFMSAALGEIEALAINGNNAPAPAAPAAKALQPAPAP
jgi:hypothetical protein